MGEQTRRRRVLVAGCLCGIAMGCAPGPDPSRDIVLLARGMTFVQEEWPDRPNPVIRLRRGERVRLVVRNEAPGLLHDLAIPTLDVDIAQMRAGESRDVTFTAPVAEGQHEYRCRPHAAMMKGIIEIVP